VDNTGWEGQGEVWCHVQSFEGGSLRLCRLGIDRLALMSKFDYVLAHT
jgi:hypothetical protein